MATLSIRQKLLSYLATADDNKVQAVFTLLESDIQNESKFTLTDEQLAILDLERDLHISGQSKSYSRDEATQIIRGLRAF